MSSAQKMIEAEKELVENNHEVILPKNTNKYAEKVLKEKDAHESTKNKIEHDLIRDYFGEIKNADAVLIVNIDKNGIKNYIGGNSFLEMGFAHVLDKKLYLYDDIPDLSYKDEMVAMQPIVINQDLSKIK